jgi:hypothetical protein
MKIHLNRKAQNENTKIHVQVRTPDCLCRCGKASMPVRRGSQAAQAKAARAAVIGQ